MNENHDHARVLCMLYVVCCMLYVVYCIWRFFLHTRHGHSILRGHPRFLINSYYLIIYQVPTTRSEWIGLDVSAKTRDKFGHKTTTGVLISSYPLYQDNITELNCFSLKICRSFSLDPRSHIPTYQNDDKIVASDLDDQARLPRV